MKRNAKQQKQPIRVRECVCHRKAIKEIDTHKHLGAVTYNENNDWVAAPIARLR